MKRRETTQHAIAFAVLLRELLGGPCTALELSAETGMRHETVLGWIRAMRRQHVLYVAAWVEDSAGRRTTAAYRIGDKPDAIRNPMPRIEVVRRYRARAAVRAANDAITRKAA